MGSVPMRPDPLAIRKGIRAHRRESKYERIGAAIEKVVLAVSSAEVGEIGKEQSGDMSYTFYIDSTASCAVAQSPRGSGSGTHAGAGRARPGGGALALVALNPLVPALAADAIVLAKLSDAYSEKGLVFTLTPNSPDSSHARSAPSNTTRRRSRHFEEDL
jgi:hypothetical protein